VNKDRQIADLEQEVGELSRFNARSREQRPKYDKILLDVYAEHQPMAVKSRDDVILELRCCRCQTDEHHTWKTDNYLPWPCPTIAPFVAIATYKYHEDDSSVVTDPEVTE
jgi:hypothetical protein